MTLRGSRTGPLQVRTLLAPFFAHNKPRGAAVLLMLLPMTIKPLPFRPLLSVLAIFSLHFSPVVRGAMGEIKTPMLLVKDQPETQAALEKALQRPDAKYLRGHWLNRWSSFTPSSAGDERVGFARQPLDR
jgi:hypothetical protein